MPFRGAKCSTQLNERWLIINKLVTLYTATSRFEAIDPAILRPGRIDEHIYLQTPGKEVFHVLKRHFVVYTFIK